MSFSTERRITVTSGFVSTAARPNNPGYSTQKAKESISIMLHIFPFDHPVSIFIFLGVDLKDWVDSSSSMRVPTHYCKTSRRHASFLTPSSVKSRSMVSPPLVTFTDMSSSFQVSKDKSP